MRDIEGFLRQNEEWFEKAVLFSVSQNLEVYAKLKETLCVNLPSNVNRDKVRADDPRRYHRDFRTYVLNDIYFVIRDYNESSLKIRAMAPELPFVPMSADMLGKLMHSYAEEGRGITENEIPICRKIYEEVTNGMTSDSVGVVLNMFSTWLKKRRLLLASNSIDGDAATLDSNSVLENLIGMRDELEKISSPVKGDGKKMFRFGDGHKNQRPKVQRWSSGFKDLDDRIGGGFATGQSTLFVAGSGVGKTVMAVNLTSRFVAQGLYGLYISTEQKHWELESRFASSMLSVPFNTVMNNFDPAVNLNAQKLEEYNNNVLPMLEERLAIYNWSDEGGAIVDRLPGVIEEFKDTHGGKLHFIICDWIGGGLGTIDTSRPDSLRLIYQNTADYLAKMDEYITVSFAQAHPSKAYNRLRIGQDAISECKSMGRAMYNIIGITGFGSIRTEKGLSLEDLDKPQFTIDQCLFIEKAREGSGGIVQVKRNFHVQRFDPKS